MPAKPKPGDILEIPLPNGSFAYSQYLMLSKMGPIIEVVDLVSLTRVDLARVATAKPMFPPVIAGLHAAVKSGEWRIVGNIPPRDHEHPRFVSTLYDQETGEARTWFLWDGQKDTPLGPALPEKYKVLEYLVVWNPSDIATRIETGVIPFPYGDLINHNRFNPKPREPHHG